LTAPPGTGQQVDASYAAAAPERRDGAADDRSYSAPFWFEYLVLIGGVAVLSFGGIGLLLADLGHYSAALALSLGAIGTVAGVLLGRPRHDGMSPRGRGATLPALVMCAVAIGIAAWNAAYIGHHVAIGRDPGVYANAGRWLAGHSTLVIPASAVPIPHVDWSAGGAYLLADGTQQFQFPHFLPAVLAEAHNIGGDALMFRLPAALGAVALLMGYAVGCRVIRRPWLALAAVTGIGLSLPQLSVSRDTYSEVATQLLLWTGLVFLLRGYEKRTAGPVFLGGLAVGGTLMTRIDAVAYLVPLPVLAAVCWLAVTPGAERRALLRLHAAALLGVLPTAILGTVDVQRRAGHYYGDLHSQVTKLYLALGLSVALALALVALAPRLAAARPWLAAQRGRFGIGVTSIIAVGLVAAWSLRPAGPKQTLTGPVAPTGGLERLENLPFQPERSYGEQSMRWIEWYIGPIALVAAIAGLCVLSVRVIRRGSASAFVLLAMCGAITTIYVWRPNIRPDQVWAMRHFVPASLPLLMLAAAVAVDALVTASGARLPGSAWPRRTAIAGAAAVIAFPLGATLPVARFQPYANYLPLVRQTCTTLGPDAAVLVPAGDPDQELMQPLRAWCDLPVARFTAPLTVAQLRDVTTAFQAEGRTPWVLAGAPATITKAGPRLAPRLIGTAVSNREIQQTLSRPPENYMTLTLTVYAAKAPS
jgi:hypothetical protein